MCVRYEASIDKHHLLNYWWFVTENGKELVNETCADLEDGKRKAEQWLKINR